VTSEWRVLIVGGGIAGLALARMLARIGIRPEVIEREPVWRPAGTGMYLPGNAACALRALGLDAQVACRSVEIPRQRFCDERGRLLCEVNVAELWISGAMPRHTSSRTHAAVLRVRRSRQHAAGHARRRSRHPRLTIEEVALDSWLREHVVLVGDAAHATSPNVAQGAAMALEDALVLA
jgi:2-polyprenyl-6-methoxyphenol hydroxylase-like FAD-dependent oxidoreductase